MTPPFTVVNHVRVTHLCLIIYLWQFKVLII